MLNGKEPQWAMAIADEFQRGYELGKSDALDFREARQHEGDVELFDGYVLGFELRMQWLHLNDAWHEANKEFGTSSQEAKQAHARWLAWNGRCQALDWEHGSYGRKL